MSLLPLLCSSLAIVLFRPPEPATPASGIRFEKSLSGAMERASTEKRPLWVILQSRPPSSGKAMPYPWFTNGRIASLAAGCVAVLGIRGPVGKKAPKKPSRELSCYTAIRNDILGVDALTPVAPQHLLLDPRGQILLAAPIDCSVGELEWLLLEARRRLDPSFVPEFGPRAKAPFLLRDKSPLPPTERDKAGSPDEIAALVADIRKTKRLRAAGRKKLPQIACSDRQDAIRFADAEMKSAHDGMKQTALRWIAQRSPRNCGWGKLAAQWLGHRNTELRSSAAKVLLALHEEKLLGALRKQYGHEKEPTIRGILLRAEARSAPTNSSVLKEIQKLAFKGKLLDLRVSAVLALAHIEVRSSVQALLGQILSTDEPRVRSTAAYAIAMRRDRELLQALQARVKVESDADAKAWMERAVRVFQSGDAKAFRKFPEWALGNAPQLAPSKQSEGKKNKERKKRGSREERKARAKKRRAARKKKGEGKSKV